jgi:ribosomal protein L39E
MHSVRTFAGSISTSACLSLAADRPVRDLASETLPEGLRAVWRKMSRHAVVLNRANRVPIAHWSPKPRLYQAARQERSLPLWLVVGEARAGAARPPVRSASIRRDENRWSTINNIDIIDPHAEEPAHAGVLRLLAFPPAAALGKPDPRGGFTARLCPIVGSIDEVPLAPFSSGATAVSSRPRAFETLHHKTATIRSHPAPPNVFLRADQAPRNPTRRLDAFLSGCRAAEEGSAGTS